MILVLAAALTATTVDPAIGAAPWTEVRQAIGEPICVLANHLPDGSESYNAVAGLRDQCNLTPAATPLQRAVDKAYAAAQPLTASMNPDGLDAAFEQGLSAGERTRRAKEVYIASEDFLRAIVPRVRNALTSEGLVCTGCPVFRPRPIRKLTWAEFAPYLAAHAWPDPVQTPKDASGKPSGRPKYSFHVCGGLNGIGEMKDPDPLLVRAGFVAAYQNASFLQSAGTQFGEALNAPEFLKLEDDEARTRFLRSSVPSETVKDPTARLEACRVLAGMSADLGIEITDCSGRLPARNGSR